MQTQIQTLCTDTGQALNWIQSHLGYETIYAAAVQMLTYTSATYLLLKGYLNKSGYASAVFSVLFNVTKREFSLVFPPLRDRKSHSYQCSLAKMQDSSLSSPSYCNNFNNSN